MALHGLVEPLRLLVVAVGFLTRMPVPASGVGADDLRRASACFPLVGLGVAGAGIGVRAAVEPIWGAGVATIAAIAAMVLVTGAFHEDGLADTADGLWGGWDPAARLAIMRDSRIGTYGTVALILVIGLRAGLLLPLGLADFARAVACGHVLGRASTLLLGRLLPAATPHPAAPARPLSGPPAAEPADQAADTVAQVLGSRERAAGPVGHAAGAPGEEIGQAGAVEAARAVGRPRLGASVVGTLGVRGITFAAVVVAATVGVAARGWAPVPLAAGLIVCLGCARLFRRRLGGVTGDAFGAANQLVDLAAVAAVAALARAGLL